MLNSIKLTNFRKHTNSTFDFNEGLTAIRGSNELGKTTITEGVAYALFGVKAIRTSLDDTVTYGQPVASLKVELVLTVDGVVYTVTRGKPGAEVNYAGGQVTGQTETVNFICRLLKVDAAGASRLMLAAQTEIRGALESGPKATTELIEKLAEFSQIDDLIELMQEKLALGNGAAAQAQLDAAQARLDRANLVEEPDLLAMQKAVDERAAACLTASFTVVQAQATASAAQQAHAVAQAQAGEIASLTVALTSTKAKLEAAKALGQELANITIVSPDNVDDQIQGLLAHKADASIAINAALAYKQVQTLLGETGISRYSQGAAHWQEDLDAARVKLDDARAKTRKSDVTLAALHAKLSSGSCGFCGQDFSKLPSVKAQNDQLQALITAEVAEANLTEAEAVTQAETIKVLNNIQSEGRPLLTAFQKYAQYLVADESVYPPLLLWKGALPDASAEQPDYDAAVKSLRAQAKAADAHQEAIRANSVSVKTHSDALGATQKRLAEIGARGDTDKTHTASVAAVDALSTARDNERSLTHSHRNATDALNEDTRVWAWAVKEKEGSASAVSLAAEALKALDFNNALLKKVRAARPVIADKLWNLVLSAVSSYFSEMRGFKSVVSKTADGFMVDDHPVQTLSGSTLDILGLAIRVALVRTFLPSAPFLVLDEPCASMDTARTESLLGFLVAVGFKQIILITHEEVSETIADHIITLGE